MKAKKHARYNELKKAAEILGLEFQDSERKESEQVVGEDYVLIISDGIGEYRQIQYTLKSKDRHDDGWEYELKEDDTTV